MKNLLSALSVLIFVGASGAQHVQLPAPPIHVHLPGSAVLPSNKPVVLPTKQHTPKPAPTVKVELPKQSPPGHVSKGGIPHAGKGKKGAAVPIMGTTVNPALLPDNEDHTRDYGEYVIKHEGRVINTLPSWGTVPRHSLWCLSGDTGCILEVYHNGALIDTIRPEFTPFRLKPLR